MAPSHASLTTSKRLNSFLVIVTVSFLIVTLSQNAYGVTLSQTNNKAFHSLFTNKDADYIILKL